MQKVRSLGLLKEGTLQSEEAVDKAKKLKIKRRSCK